MLAIVHCIQFRNEIPFFINTYLRIIHQSCKIYCKPVLSKTGLILLPSTVRSEELEGKQTINISCTNPSDFKNSFVPFPACDRTVYTSMNMTRFCRDNDKCSSLSSCAFRRNWQYVTEGQLDFFQSPKRTNNFIRNNSSQNHNATTYLLKLHSHVTSITIMYPTFGSAIRTV